MASYRFKWPYPADSVTVTGTFDGWGEKIELENKGRYWEKVIPLSATKDKIYYKYIVNGNWRVDPSHAVEKDHEGNENNVLDPEDIIYDTAIMNSVGPGATTVGLAGAAGVAGAGAASTVADASLPKPVGGQPSADPAPPGAFPDTSEIPKGTLQDMVVGVNPIPSTGSASNPVNLKPGEAVPDPSTLTGNTVDSTVKLDKDTYERGAGGASFSPSQERGGDPSSASFGRPAASGGSGTFIPESSSFMNDTSGDTVSSVGPGASSTILAGQQPIEPRGQPQVIRKEDDKDGEIGLPVIIGGGAVAAGAAGAIASVGPDATSTSKAGEQPIQPRGEPTIIKESEGGNPNVSSVGPGATSTILAGEQPIESRTGPQVLRESDNQDGGASPLVPIAGGGTAISSVGPDATTTGLAGKQPLESQQNGDLDRATTSTVPAEVTESQKEANVDPEASANAEAVKEKSQAEQELLSKVKETNAAGEPAPTDSAATATRVPTATSASGAPQLGDPVAGVAPISMDDSKPTVATREALQGTDASKDGLNASAESQAKPPSAAQAAATKAAQHQDAGPSTPGPKVTSGVGESSTPQTSTPQKRHSLVDRLRNSGTPESSKTGESTPDSKKSKRRSFLKRIKDKLSS